MPPRKKFALNRPTHGYLITLDISGFSRAEAPNGFLDHRMDLFQAVETTPLFPEASEEGNMKVGFLGDELRLAVHSEVGPGEVKGFVSEVMANLRERNKRKRRKFQTWVKGTVLEGVLTVGEWHDREYFNGPLTFEAQDVMSKLEPNEVAVNGTFRQSLRNAGLPVSDLKERVILGEARYVLVFEVPA